MPRGARSRRSRLSKDTRQRARLLADDLEVKYAAATVGVSFATYRAWTLGRGTISRREREYLQWAWENRDEWSDLIYQAEEEGTPEEEIRQGIRKLIRIPRLGDARFRGTRYGAHRLKIKYRYSGDMPSTTRQRLTNIFLGLGVEPSGLLAIYFKPRH